MINEGYGAPFVLVYNQKDEEITPHKISRFRYVHSEKADDASIIVIESQDENLPDHPDYQDNKQIKVQWGYIGGKTSKKHTLYIFDSSVSYDELGVRIELQCYDRLAYLKLTSTNTVHTDSSVSDLAKTMADNNGMFYNEEKDELVFTTDRSSASSSILKNDALFTTATDNTATNFKQYVAIPQANKSDFKLLRETLDKEPGGPYVLEGRDDELIIRKRNFNQKPLFTYRWKSESGYLLKFNPATKNKSHRPGSTNISASGWNPELKTYIMGDIGQVHDKDKVLSDNLDFSYRSYNKSGEGQEPGNKENKTNDQTKDETFIDSASGDSESDTESAPSIPRDENQVDSEINEGLKWTNYQISTNSPNILKSNGEYKLATESTSVIINKGYYLKPDLNENHDTLGDNPKDISAEAINRRKQTELDNNSATATILGDPDLESGKIIGILNVSKKHSGNYYITQAIHEVNADHPYLVELSLVRQGDNTQIKSDKAKSKSLQKGINKTDAVDKPFESNKSIQRLLE